MQEKIDRRSFLGASIAAGAGTALLNSAELLKYLTSSTAVDDVMSVLQTHLDLDEKHRPLVEEFTRSLRRGVEHHESGAQFDAALAGAVDRGQLAVYILQEFVISTNYVSYARGVDRQLVMTPSLQTTRTTDALV